MKEKPKLIGDAMKIRLEKLTQGDFENLYAFEVKNRAYFEKTVPSRGDDYYELPNFIRKNDMLLEEQAQQLSYFYLIKNELEEIIGRINVIDIDKDQRLGHIGYRVGKEFSGKGVAHTALQLVLDLMRQQGMLIIEAQTTTNNIASQKVLEKNGFKQLDRSGESFEMNGQNFTFTYYRWINS